MSSLNTPVEPSGPTLEVVALGGLREFGMNLMAFSFGETLVVVDAGVTFPESELPGVDLITPDLTYLQEHRHRIAGLHGPRGGLRERHTLESPPHEYPGQLARAHRLPHHQRGR